MRPRHYAGESRGNIHLFGFEVDASMRPRHYAGESWLKKSDNLDDDGASMRPRHYAGESHPLRRLATRGVQRFNEAPALRRGKLGRSKSEGQALAELQ